MVQEKLNLLRNHAFFQGVEESYLVEMSEMAEIVQVTENKFLAQKGEPANFFYLLLDGKCQVLGEGKSAVIQTLCPGEVFGWSWIIPPFRWNFDAKAIEPTRVLAVNADRLREYCEAHTDLGYDLMKRFATILVSRLRATRLQVMDVYGDKGSPKGKPLT